MDRDTLETLVKVHQAEIYRYMRYLGAGSALAEDLVQETFLAAFRSAKQPGMAGVRGRSAWLRAIGRNLFFNACRRRKDLPVAVDSQWLQQAEAAWDAQLLREGDGFETVEALRACVEALPARQRDVLDLRYRQGKSRTEMARQCRMTGDGIKSLLRRIRTALAECIQRRLAKEPRP